MIKHINDIAISCNCDIVYIVQLRFRNQEFRNCNVIFTKGEVLIMSKALVAYFSASGVTAKLAKRLAEAIGADLHEIRPEVPYTEADLNWMDKKSRSSVEMSDKAFRPAVANKVENMEQYQVIFTAFPIWWYVAPTIVNSFLEQYNLSGKTVIPLATSGSSGMGNTNKELAGSCPGAELKEGKRFPADASAEELKAWAEGFGI